MHTTHKELNTILNELASYIDSTNHDQISKLLNTLAIVDLAHILESSPPKERHICWKNLSHEQKSSVLYTLGEDVRQEFLNNLTTKSIASLIKDYEVDEGE